MKKKICVIGLGYIGLPTSVMFASSGNEVVGVDINKKTIDTLNRGEIHIEEPKLKDLYLEVIEAGNFRAQLIPEESDAFIIAVPTPNTHDESKSCDLTCVLSAIRSIIPFLKKENLIIIESTISPRTIEDVILPIVERAGFKVGEDIYIAHCPERVLPGKIIEEMLTNNRIIGGCTDKCSEKAAELYKQFVLGEVIITNAKTAEMTKLMENTFRDVNIALANELAKVCNSLEINVLDVINMANKHPRVNIHQPGPGVGGHCLAVDPYFIVEKAPELARMISLSREINKSMPEYIVQKIDRMMKHIDDPKIAVFGITYKGNIDDVRESPALEIIELLREKEYRISIHDPHVKLRKLPLTSGEKALEGADLLLILADHDEFNRDSLIKMMSKMRHQMIFDTKNTIKNWDEYKDARINGEVLADGNIIVKDMGNIF